MYAEKEELNVTLLASIFSKATHIEVKSNYIIIFKIDKMTFAVSKIKQMVNYLKHP